MTEKIGAKRLIEITANPAMTGFTASKILWVKNNEPEIYEKCVKILLPKDYIRYMLTGEFAAEVSDASGMQLLDVPARQWSGEVLEKLGIDKGLLAPVYESVEISGRVSKRAAELTGLAEGTPVVGGAGDQAAGGVGNGIVREGILSATLGTSGVVFAHTDKMTLDPKGRVHTLCHAVPGCWHVMGVTQAAGLSLKWFRDNFCIPEIETAKQMEIDPYVLLDKEAELSPAGCDGLYYLPYLMGERTPHLDPDARGVFFGLSARHSRRDMLRAVMEGVGYSMKDCLEIIKGMGVPIKEVRASGGGGKSPFWRQMLADMFGKTIVTTNSTEGPALGVAILAGVGAGVYASVSEGCDIAVIPKSRQRADKQANALYKKHYAVYKSLYKSLKREFKKSAQIQL
jgi:xylulokinase